ncbi:MAG: hypothetical protein R2712_01700 [Vicinamibacterales bacterium]
MLALNQLAAAYEDMNHYLEAAQVWEHMARQFPGNPAEVWFKLGELYERRLKDTEKARNAYGHVPPESPRYKDAQQQRTAGSTRASGPDYRPRAWMSVAPVTASIEITRSPVPGVASLRRGPHVSRVVIGMSDVMVPLSASARIRASARGGDIRSVTSPLKARSRNSPAGSRWPSWRDRADAGFEPQDAEDVRAVDGPRSTNADSSPRKRRGSAAPR